MLPFPLQTETAATFTASRALSGTELKSFTTCPCSTLSFLSGSAAVLSVCPWLPPFPAVSSHSRSASQQFRWDRGPHGSAQPLQEGSVLCKPGASTFSPLPGAHYANVFASKEISISHVWFADALSKIPASWKSTIFGAPLALGREISH